MMPFCKFYVVMMFLSLLSCVISLLKFTTDFVKLFVVLLGIMSWWFSAYIYENNFLIS